MTFEEARVYLRTRQGFHVKVGTRNIRAVAAALGRPERRFPRVIVAGTNGKGSTVAIVESVLAALGLRVGRFTSPHLVSVRERIRIGGRELAPEVFAGHVAAVARAAASLPAEHQPSFFETITATAFTAFAEARVDAAVFEVGMGGRWDATTATDSPLGLVTRIALDHQRYLGPTVEAIAAEKGAVARPGGELLAGVQVPSVVEVLRESARSAGARFFDVGGECEARFAIGRSGSGGRLDTPEAGYDDLWLPLPGSHQVENLTLAVRAVERFAARFGGGPPDPARLREGVASVRWPGRLEWLREAPGCPRVLLDAAHNASGADRLAAYLAGLGRERRPRVLLFGVTRDKPAEQMLASLLPHFDGVVFAEAASRRARSSAELLALAVPPASRNGEHGEAAAEAEPDLRAALRRVAERAGTRGEIVIAGSIYLLGDVLARLAAGVPGLPRASQGRPGHPPDEAEPMPLGAGTAAAPTGGAGGRLRP